MKNQQKDILFLCQFFFPEYNSSATLPFDTAKWLASHGFTVDSLVGYPKEYCTDTHLPLEETVEGVRIKRIKYVQTGRTGTLGRLTNYLSFTLHALLNITRLKDYKIVIVYSNPPVLPIVPIRAKKKYGTKFVFVAYDVYPEVAYASRTLTPDSMISKVMNRINQRLYSQADGVVALTNEMREFLLANRKGLSPDRVVTIPNWAHEKRSKPDRSAYERFGYRDGQFIVSYFGNMGTVQDMETLMQAAVLLKDDERVRFMIVGHGNKMPNVKSIIEKEGLKYVQLLSFLTGDAFQQAVAISSCCVVSLEKGLRGTVAPSKYYSYLQGGKPVLAVVEQESYLAEEITRAQIGYAVENGDGEGLKDAVLELLEDSEACSAMSERAWALYEQEYTYEAAMRKYTQMICNILLNEDLGKTS